MHEFCEQSTCVCVCVSSNPAPSACLGVETDFIIDTEATLICCKRSGNWSPLAGAIAQWIAEPWFCSCPSAALRCWHCPGDGHPGGRCPFPPAGPCPDPSVGLHKLGQPWSSAARWAALTAVSSQQPRSRGSVMGAGEAARFCRMDKK